MTGASLDSRSSGIAIVGMAGRFPGARNIAQFWQNLSNGVESLTALTDEELLRAGVDPVSLRDPAYVKTAAVLEDFDRFDASFFGLSPRDAAIMDPQHRVFLECVWEALEHAGWNPDRFPGSIGVYAGSGMNSYFMFNLLANPELMRNAGLFLLKQTGNDKDVLATRVSYQLNLTGPSMTIQTACSTSLVAVHVACRSLLGHECDMALAGGVTIEIPHRTGYLYREGEILSRDGHCRAFDADATGTVFSSGAGVVVLRRLEDALADGDCIHAVIRGTAINNDGCRKAGYLAPSVSGQDEVRGRGFVCRSGGCGFDFLRGNARHRNSGGRPDRDYGSRQGVSPEYRKARILRGRITQEQRRAPRRCGRCGRPHQEWSCRSKTSRFRRVCISPGPIR